MYLEWLQDYELKIEKVDKHHKNLVKIINNLSDAYVKHMSKEVIETIFGNLIQYGAYHFTIEEVVMRNNNYPRYELHKKDHQLFMMRMKIFELDYKRGDTLVLKTTIDYLNNWLVDHIMVEDRQYSMILHDKF